MLINKLLKSIGLAAITAATMSGCLPTPDVKPEYKDQPALEQRPVISITSSDAIAGNLEEAYVIAGDSITLNVRMSSANGLKSFRLVRATSLAPNFIDLSSANLTGSEDNRSVGFRVPLTNSSWINLGLYVRDNKDFESFTFYRMIVQRNTTGTNDREVVLYRQGQDPAVAVAGTVYAQFISTRKQTVASRYRNNLSIDLAYGVDNAGDPYLFSPDLPIADINANFSGFPSAGITDAFSGGVWETNAPNVSRFNTDSLRRVWTPTAANQKVKIAPNKTYLVRCFPASQLTPPYLAAVNVTSIADSVRFGSGPTAIIRRARGLQMRAVVRILTF